MPDVEAWQQFVKSRGRDLRKISKGTHYEMEIGDIANSAWEIANEIEGKRKSEIDFADSVDQGLVLSFLHNRHVKYADKKIRYAERDHHVDNEESSTGPKRSTLSLITAALGSDPLVRLLSEEESRRVCLEARRKSYGEAVAYLLLLIKYNGAVALAKTLGIAYGTLSTRIARAVSSLDVQPTLFDGVEMIDPDLKVHTKRKCIAKRNAFFEPQQTHLCIDPA